MAPNTRLVTLQKSVIINKWEYAEFLSRNDTGAPRPPLKSCKINTTARGLCWRMKKGRYPGYTICIYYDVVPSGWFLSISKFRVLARINLINLSTSFLLWIIIILYLYRYNDILCAPHVRTFHDRLLVHINTRIEWNKTLRYIQGLLSYGIYIKRIRRPWRTIRVKLRSFI